MWNNLDEILIFADEFYSINFNVGYSKMKHFWLILLFSVLHGLCCICCRTLGIDDFWALTLLTIAMTFVLAYLRGFRFYFIITAIILVNVLAYLIGNALPLALRSFFGMSMWINVLSTTVTTLILGTVFELVTNLVFKIGGEAVSVNVALQNKEFRQRWIVRINDRIVPVKTEQIAFFYSENKCNYLVTFDGDKFIIDSTMDSIIDDLDPECFFRINRGCILSLASIESAVVNSGRYSVQVHPSLGISMNVARSRVEEFVRWLG